MAGSSVGGPIGAGLGAMAPIVAGGALRGQINRSTQRGLAQVSEMTRRRSPLFNERFAAGQTLSGPTVAHEAVLRALLSMPSSTAQSVMDR